MKKQLALLSFVFLFPTLVLAAEPVGEVIYMSGTLVAQRSDGTVKVMGPKSAVLEGDLLVTSEKGFAQIKMNDGMTMTVRPESNLKVEAYHFKKNAPQSDSAIFRLIRGGFRTLTGLIGKRGNKDAYTLRAPTATIGIRGTEYSARLCGSNECSGGAGADNSKSAPAVQPAGKVMLLQGGMQAVDPSGLARKLVLGSAILEGDTLATEANSFGVIAFRDGGRITLQEKSRFQVEKFKYGAGEENAVLRLLKGGVRIVTGLIGRANHDRYRFGLANTATIGIRGTGLDAWCNGACADSGSSGATQDNPLAGAGVYVWSGEVVLVTPEGSVTVALQQAAIIARESGKPVPLFLVPKSILDNAVPRPDGVPVDLDKEFGNDASGAGLYVTVHDGRVVVSQGGKILDLGAGDSAFANGLDLMKLQTPPVFMNFDPASMDSGGSGATGGKGCVVLPL